MPGLSCNACNAEFPDEASQRSHYRSEWHRHNLKRKVAGVPGFTEALFKMRVEALVAEKKEAEISERMLYKCSICAKEYATRKAHAQHLRSKLHISRASGLSKSSDHDVAIVRVAPSRLSENEQTSASNESSFLEKQVIWKGSQINAHQSARESESSDEWEEVDADDITDSETEVIVDRADLDREHDDGPGPNASPMDFEEQWDVNRCFICDMRADGSVEACMEHMHKVHGFFIPDAEFLKDPCGMLHYLALKVTKGFMCLYCSESGKEFQSLEAVRKHMVAKSHCKLPYEDGESGSKELEDFYDFSGSYVQKDGSQILDIDHLKAPVDLGTGGFELVVKSGSEDGVMKMIGSREFSQYYRQRPKPTDQRDSILVNALVARYRSMGLETKQRDRRLRVSGNMRKVQAATLEAMRTKFGMKNNVIWNLPKNSPF